MKKLMLGLMIAFAVTAEAETISDVQIGDLIYSLDTETKTATLTRRYELKLTKVDVSGVEWNGDNYIVTSVDGAVFWSCSSLASVSLPNATTIGEVAFKECSSLTSLSLPNATTVAAEAFWGCPLTSVELPSATTIGEYVFRKCSSLVSVSLPNATTIENNAFNGCSSLTSVSLPNATTIGMHAFMDCSSLASVSLPNATTIGDDAFKRCSLLTSVSLPSATTIGSMAFQSCGSLTSISLPSAMTIKSYAFTECPSLTSVSLPNAKTIGVDAFYQCLKLEKIVANVPMAMTLKNNKSFYGIREGCKILPEYCAVEPHSAEHTTAKVYTDGAEATGNPIVVVSNATVDVVFTADYGYCFRDYTTVQTNTVTATDDPTVVVGPVAIRNTVVVEPHPAEHTTLAKVYTNGVEVTSDPIEVLSNAMVSVVFTAAGGYCFADHTLVQTNTVEATDDPTKVDGPTVVKIPSLGEDEVRKAEWEAETTITVVSTALKSGDKILDKGEYEYACEFYGVEVKAEPTAEDFKFVPEGSVVVPEEQVIGSDEIAVKKESIAAPSAGTVKVEDNKVQLGVTVLKTSDLTAEKKEWGEVTLTADDVKVVDGKIVISVPVDSASGFMILQSGDAKVSDAAVTHEPWYTPTAED